MGKLVIGVWARYNALTSAYSKHKQMNDGCALVARWIAR